MSFIGTVEEGLVYAPGYFLAHEECERKTRQIAQAGATTAANGAKYVKMGQRQHLKQRALLLSKLLRL